jgi:adenylate cyclase
VLDKPSKQVGMASTRRLTAILAADVAGYSRLMEADEEGTHDRLRAHFQQLVNPKIAGHDGRIVKTTGDGLLAEFASVVDAVRCAAEIQRGMIDRDAQMPEVRRIRFRIGINLGDVIAEGADIFGDGVNVAARLEALAEPGGICCSGTVHDHIRDRLPYPFDDLGEQSVKNIARPVRVYVLRPDSITNLPAASASLATPASQPAVAPRLSIVVLPFANLSNDPEQQYFADGITEDLTTDLSRIEGSFVISRNTAFTYRSKPIDTKQIGRELGVRYVLEGSVRRSGNQIRVNAQLIDAESDANLWAERFDRDAGDLFALQDEITSRIAISLDLAMVGAEAARATEDPDALDYILRGRAEWNKPHTRDNSAMAISLFERALVLDPHSIGAQSFLAIALTGRVLNGMSNSRAADIVRAEELVGQALASAYGNPLAHFAKGQLLRAQGRCEDAVLEYETVLASDHNSASAIAHIGRCKIYVGPIQEAIPLEEQAIRLSPRDPNLGLWYFRIGQAHLLQSRTDEAILSLEMARNASPALAFVHAWLASAYGLKGETERAVAELAEARTLSSDDRYPSIARAEAAEARNFVAPATRALLRTTYLVGLRRAGVPEE